MSELSEKEQALVERYDAAIAAEKAQVDQLVEAFKGLRIEFEALKAAIPPESTALLDAMEARLTATEGIYTPEEPTV